MYYCVSIKYFDLILSYLRFSLEIIYLRIYRMIYDVEVVRIYAISGREVCLQGVEGDVRIGEGDAAKRLN